MSVDRVIAKVRNGFARAGAKVGRGELVCTVRRYHEDEPGAVGAPRTPWSASEPGGLPFNLYPATCIIVLRDVGDAAAVGPAVSRRTLLMAAGGVVPQTTDTIAVGVAPSSVGPTTLFEEIVRVGAEEIGGAPFMFEIELKA